MILTRHIDIISKSMNDFTSIVNKFFYSTILLPVGYQKERMLNFAIQNDGLKIFECKTFLEKLYLLFLNTDRLTYQLVYIDELNKLKRNCPQTYQNFNYEKAIFEHNLNSLSKIFCNISFNSLQNFMKIKIEVILEYTLKMIIEGKIKATIDEERNFILFEKEPSLSLNFDKQIQNFCLKALYLSDYIKNS